MKYKHIPSAVHNWTHSFMSNNNFVDGGFVYEDMLRLARERRGERIVISWIPVRTEELFGLTPRIRTCVSFYRMGLTEFLQRQKIDPVALAELRTEVYVADNFRMYVRGYALDDRGKEHSAFVWS